MPNGIRVLDPRATGGQTVGDNPWALWQAMQSPSAYTCTFCGQEHTGERFLELTGQEPRQPVILPRTPQQWVVMQSRLGRRLACPGCRWARPTPVEAPKRRKTTLD